MTVADALPEDVPAFEVAVVGSGVNGCLLARALGRKGMRTLLLEAGGDDGPETGEGWVAEVADLPFEGATAGRRRGFGGSGAWWAGQCAPFGPLDFEERAWVPGSGWPLRLQQLQPWYDAAQDALGIPGERFDEGHWRARRVVPPVALGLEHRFSAFLPQPDVAALVRSELAASPVVTVALHAHVVEVHRRPASTAVGGVEVQDRTGRRRLLPAAVVVLAAGGIETPRLLLASRSTDPVGLGNSHDLVGRYLHDHPSGLAARVQPRDPRLLQDLYAMMYGRRTRHWARIVLPEAEQRSQQLVGAVANAVFEHPPGGPVDALKKLARRYTGRDPLRDRSGGLRLALDAARSAPAVPAVLWRRYARGLSPAQRPHAVWLRTAAEQPPRASSRVVLAAHRDERGLPRASVHWSIGEEERTAQRALVSLVARQWAAAGLADVEPMPWLSDPGTEWRTHQVDAYHHSGTARMALSPAHGVVDADLRVHDVPGLYVAGSAVFPTSSSANPTFTSAALTLRLADHIERSQ